MKKRTFFSLLLSAVLAMPLLTLTAVGAEPEPLQDAHVASDDHVNVFLNFSGSWGNTLTPLSLQLTAVGDTPDSAEGLTDGGVYTIYDASDGATRYMHVTPGTAQTNQCMKPETNGTHDFIFHKVSDGEETVWTIESAAWEGYYLMAGETVEEHVQLKVTDNESEYGTFYIWADSERSGYYHISWELAFETREPELVPNHYTGVSEGQPMDKESVNSDYFRIPGITTLHNGWQAAVADIRWQSANDNPANMDTIFSLSKDNGATWTWETLNYLGDYGISVNSNLSASFIDPAILQTENGDIWVAVDMTPFMFGGTRNDGLSNNGTGFDENGYLLVTKMKKTGPSAQTPKNPGQYGYRVDLSGESGGTETASDLWGTAHPVYPIFEEGDPSALTGFYVDAFLNLYHKDEEGGLLPVECEQYGGYFQDLTQNNITFAQSEWRLFPTFYFCLRRGVINGEEIVWDEPIYPNVRDGMKTFFYGVCPGRGTTVTVTDENGVSHERIMFQAYDNSTGTEYTCAFYSDDGGKTWQRGKRANQMGTSGGGKSSESQIVLLPDGNLRMYSRNNATHITYTDSVDGGVTWGKYKRDKTLSYVGNCMVSFINVDGALLTPDGEVLTNLIMGSYPKGEGRANGTVRIGYMENKDGEITVKWLPTARAFDKKLTGAFQYSCLTQARNSDGTYQDGFAILYEPNDAKGVTCQYLSFDVSDVLGEGYLLSWTVPVDAQTDGGEAAPAEETSAETTAETSAGEETAAETPAGEETTAETSAGEEEQGGGANMALVIGIVVLVVIGVGAAFVAIKMKKRP